MDSYTPLTRRQSLALAVGGPLALAFLLGLLGHFLGIPAQAESAAPAPIPEGRAVPLPRPPALAPMPPAHPLTLEALSTVLAAGACESWPRAFDAPLAAISLRVAKSEGTYRYHHRGDASVLEKQGDAKGAAAAPTLAALSASLRIESRVTGPVAFVLVSAVETAGAKAARLETAAAAGRAAERVRVAAEGLGLRAEVVDRFDPAAALERFTVPATEVPLQIVVLGAVR